jgi:hypothetical protein
MDYPMRTAVIALAASGMALALAGCGKMGQVEQGRVIAYDAQTRRVTLIRESPGARSNPGVLPPVTVEAPADPNEMGPAPAAGGLLLLDTRQRRIVIYDRARQSFRTIHYAPLAERHNVPKNAVPSAVDRGGKTVTIYSPKEHTLITFPVSDELLAMPVDTWRSGDVVRYYYKDPAHALRLMNVTQTDLSKSAG